MRVRRQGREVAQFVAEILHLLLAEPSLQIGARVHSRRGMTLEINEVARLISVAGVEEMIESDFEQRRQRRVGRDVAADSWVLLVLAMHHGHRVPANQALDAPLQLRDRRDRELPLRPEWC